MPRTETTETTIYDAQDVLNNKKLKEKVINNWRERTLLDGDFNGIIEINESEKKFKENLPTLENDLSGVRLRTWILNNFIAGIEEPKKYWTCKVKGELIMNCVGVNSITRISNIHKEISCPFTGYYSDMDFLEPIMSFVKNPREGTTWEELIETESILSDLLEKERAWQMSEEYILETIEANGYEFDGNETLINYDRSIINRR